MQKLKRTARLLGLVLLMLLASVGVGISGGVPLMRSTKKEELVEIQIELVESKDEEDTNAEQI